MVGMQGYKRDLWMGGGPEGAIGAIFEVGPCEGLSVDRLSGAVQAARAPLLVAVLQGYRSICGEAWQAELRSVFPHLAHLICSAQPSVRTALADLLQAQIPKMIAQQ